jgi:hypothetical protein
LPSARITVTLDGPPETSRSVRHVEAHLALDPVHVDRVAGESCPRKERQKGPTEDDSVHVSLQSLLPVQLAIFVRAFLTE